MTLKIPVVRDILEANERLAEDNRRIFREAGLVVINLMSGPGAGKTSLLERTIEALQHEIRIGVIEGDIQSSYDALDLDILDLLVVENVGNLVCPAEFNVGEDMKAMILSVPEGDDKPLKYPLMFQESRALLINKIDLLPYVNCDVGKIRERALQLNANLEIFEISCRTGEGLDGWADWLRQQVSARKAGGDGAET
jgi:hydrogenase nickel incorporation protein HypB